MNTSAVSPGRAGLLLLLSGQMLPLIDTSITNVALDAITHTLAASATQLELIVALYGVAFAVCLAMGSKLGDNYGRRRLFMWGVALFGIASLLCGIANNIGALLAARSLYARLEGKELPAPPVDTMCGALVQYLTTENKNFQPMGANMGILPPLPAETRPRDKRLRYMAQAERAVASFQHWLEETAL